MATTPGKSGRALLTRSLMPRYKMRVIEKVTSWREVTVWTDECEDEIDAYHQFLYGNLTNLVNVSRPSSKLLHRERSEEVKEIELLEGEGGPLEDAPEDDHIGGGVTDGQS